MTDLDLDVYNECKRINTTQEDGDALIYLRTRGGKVSFVYSGFSDDLIALLISCMKQDAEMADYILISTDEYIEEDKDFTMN